MPETKQPFDASKHLTNLKGKDYLEVKYRLVWFRSDHPKGSIRTKLVERVTGAALMKAFVYDDDSVLLATGYGSETSSDFGDYLEKAETKAIGRALGAAGYGTQFTDEFDFGAEDKGRVVDSPVDRRPVQSGATTGQTVAKAPAQTSTSSKGVPAADDAPCEFPGCNNYCKAEFVNMSRKNFGKAYCGVHYSKAKSGEIETHPKETPQSKPITEEVDDDWDSLMNREGLT